MTQAAYTQALVPPEEVGRGYGARDLESMRLKKLAERLTTDRPDLKSRGVALALMRIRLEEAEAAFRMDVQNGVGGDFTQSAIGMFRSDAQKLWLAKRKPHSETEALCLAEAEAIETVGQTQRRPRTTKDQ